MTSGGRSTVSIALKNVLKSLCEWRPYLGFALFFAVFNLIFGIVTLSFLHPKKEPLVFGLICLAILLALGHFASVCFLFQRSKSYQYAADPSYADVGYSAGIAVLFAISALALIHELPKRCYSGPNEDLKELGKNICGTITAMGVSSCLAFVCMIVAAVMICVAARKAIELAKAPPPVFPSGTEASIMRWLDRSDPFVSVARSQHRQGSL